MTDKRAIVEVDDAEKYLDHPEIRSWGSSGEMVQIDCDDTVSAKIWATKMGNVEVSTDSEKITLEDAEIIEVKIFNGVNNE